MLWQNQTTIARSDNAGNYPYVNNLEYADIGYYSWICGANNSPQTTIAGVYTANTTLGGPAIFFTYNNTPNSNLGTLASNTVGPFHFDPHQSAAGNYSWEYQTPNGDLFNNTRMDPRCYFICNRLAPLQNPTGIATDLSCISDISGIFMAEANFVLNVVNECDISTSFEGFSLYGQFHTDISLGNPPGGGSVNAGDLGRSNWTMKNVGLSESPTFTLDNNYNGDLLLSHSNLDSISQTSNGRNISWSGATPPDLSASTSYSFPVTFRKPVQLPNNPETPLYLGLTLIRCPSEIDDKSWNKWAQDSGPPLPSSNDYTINLSHPLPFRYYITYTPAQTAEWQGQRGFSTNLSITPL